MSTLARIASHYKLLRGEQECFLSLDASKAMGSSNPCKNGRKVTKVEPKNKMSLQNENP
jgi:hypothetical protein